MMASTFHVNKKMKHDHPSCWLWCQHVGIEKLKHYSPAYFSQRKVMNTSSEVDATDPSTTNKVKGHETRLEEDEPSEDPDPPPRRFTESDFSQLDNFNLIYCDKCDYVFTPKGYTYHQEIRHLKPRDPTVTQYKLYDRILQKEEDQRALRLRRVNGIHTPIETSIRRDISNNDNSKANLKNLDVKSGPEHGNMKRKCEDVECWPNNRKQKICSENQRETNWDMVTKNSRGKPKNGLSRNSLLKETQTIAIDYSMKIEQLLSSSIRSFSVAFKNVSTHCGNFHSDNVLANQSTISTQQLSVHPLTNDGIKYKEKDSTKLVDTQLLEGKLGKLHIKS